MFVFDLKRADIFKRVNWSKWPIFQWAKSIKQLFFVLCVIFLLLGLYEFLVTYSTESSNFGFGLIFFTLVVAFWYIEIFWHNLKHSSDVKDILKKGEENMASVLDFETARIASEAIRSARSRRLKNLSAAVYMERAITINPDLAIVFARIMIDLDTIRKSLIEEINRQEKGKFEWSFTDDFQNLFIDALKSATERKNNLIRTSDILGVFVSRDVFRKPLIDASLKPKDVKNLLFWLDNFRKEQEEKKKFWTMKNLLKTGSIAKDWAAGYTVLLDQFSVDVTNAMRKQGFREIFAHRSEVETMEAILARRERNNALIIGESGSSRRSMIQSLANRSAMGECAGDLNYRRVVLLDIPRILASNSNIKESEIILDKIFQEVVFAENIILVIDNLHNYIGDVSAQRLGAAEISGLISSYLDSPGFKLIGITTYDGLHSHIERNSQLLSLFEKVEVVEISEEETIKIIQDRALQLENKYKILIPWQSIRDTVTLSAKYIVNLPFPEKAMGLIDEAAIATAQKRKKVVLPSTLAELITSKTQIPVGEIKEEEKETLLNLESLIHQRIINQEEAVVNIAKAMRRARTEITIRKGPMGAFLFLGPTGVGKTETAKALAEIYFGSENKMIRLDMSEFQAIKDISRIIGSTEENGLLTTPVREDPFSVVLLDEFEKAHPNIVNLFLQVFDEGHLTDGLGRKVSFLNTIIIATSNAGYQIILKVLKELTEAGSFETEKPVGRTKEVWDVVEKRLLDYIFDNGIFRPELVNRFDDLVIFKPLTKGNLLDIAGLMLKKLQKNLKEKDIDLVITESLKEKVVELGYDPVFGAREMRRVIQDKVENLIATAMLSNKIQKGDKIEIDKELNLTIN